MASQNKTDVYQYIIHMKHSNAIHIANNSENRFCSHRSSDIRQQRTVYVRSFKMYSDAIEAYKFYCRIEFRLSRLMPSCISLGYVYTNGIVSYANTTTITITQVIICIIFVYFCREAITGTKFIQLLSEWYLHIYF